MILSPFLHPNVVLAMINPKAALCTFDDQSFNTAKNHPYDCVLTSPLTLNWTTTAYRALLKRNLQPIMTNWMSHMIIIKSKSVVQKTKVWSPERWRSLWKVWTQMNCPQWSTSWWMIYYARHLTIHSSIQSVLNNAANQALQDPLRKCIIWKTSNVHIEHFSITMERQVGFLPFC